MIFRGESVQTKRRQAKKEFRIRSIPSFRSIPAGIHPPIGYRRLRFGIFGVAKRLKASANSMEHSKRRSDVTPTPCDRLLLFECSPRLLSSAKGDQRRLPRGKRGYCLRFECVDLKLRLLTAGIHHPAKSDYQKSGNVETTWLDLRYKRDIPSRIVPFSGLFYRSKCGNVEPLWWKTEKPRCCARTLPVRSTNEVFPAGRRVAEVRRGRSAD